MSSYVLSFAEAEYFLSNTIDFVTHLAPSYLEQDKRQLTIGIGCTGGMHRSVAIGQELYERLRKLGNRVFIEHRDINLEKDAVKRRFQSLSIIKPLHVQGLFIMPAVSRAFSWYSVLPR